MLSIAGISRVGGRSASDIAERFLARAGEKATGTSEEARAAIARLLAISGEPDAAAAELRALAGELGIDVAAELDALESRFGFMAALGLDLGRMRFEASFARNLDYYTSFIFELRSADPSQPKPAAGGGRYDLLMGRLGAAEEIPPSAARSGWSACRDRPHDRRSRSAARPGRAFQGRLQENAAAFFARAGLHVTQGRGARDYRGAIAGLPDVEVAFLSAGEIVGQLASGAAHIGVTART